MADEHAPVGIIDAGDVGVFAATLLLQEDMAAHHGMKYVLNGPEDICGRQIVDIVEKEIGEKVEHVKFRDVEFIEQMAEAEQTETKSVIRSIRYAPETAWEGKCSASTTSREVLGLAAPRRTLEEVWREMLDG